MEINKTQTVNIIDDYIINYENGVICKAKVINNKLITYNFTSGKIKLLPIKNIEEVLDNHWSKHYDIAQISKFETIEDLKNFNDFDNLYYLGGGSDGMVRDRNGKAVSSVLIFGDTFCSIWANIGTPKKVDEVYDIINNHKWIKKIDKVEIPYYNQGKNKTHSLRIEIKPDTETLNVVMEKLGASHIDDMVKLELLAIMGFDNTRKYKKNKI